MAKPQTGITVREAAERLGTTERAVRFRLSRGTVAGQRIDGRWWVYLDGTEVSQGRNATAATVAAELVPLIAAIADLTAQVGKLCALEEGRGGRCASCPAEPAPPPPGEATRESRPEGTRRPRWLTVLTGR